MTQTGGIISSDQLRVLAGGTGDVDPQRPTWSTPWRPLRRQRHVRAEQRQGAGGGFHHPHLVGLAGNDMTVSGIDTSASNKDQLVKTVGA